MGVRCLVKYLLGNVPKKSNCIQKLFIKDLHGKKIVIDASILLYLFLKDVPTGKNPEEILNRRLYAFINLCISYSITLHFVFDGKPPATKADTIKERIKEKKENERKYNEPTNDKFSKNNFIHLTRPMIQSSKEILSKKNISFEEAEGEADPVCANLVNSDQAYACLTNDSDLFMYKCKRVLMSYHTGTNSMMLFNFDMILKELKITSDEFRELCVVTGTDYNKSDAKDINETTEWLKQYKQIVDSSFDQKNSFSFIKWLFEYNYISQIDSYINILENVMITNF